MSIKNVKKNFTMVIPVVLILTLIIVISLTILEFLNHRDNNYFNYEVIDASAGWVTPDGREVSISSKNFYTDGRAEISRRLDNFTDQNYAVAAATLSQKLSVLVDGEIIYDTPYDSHHGDPLGNYWHIVSLPSDSSGKTLTLIYESELPTGDRNPGLIYLGDYGAVYSQLMNESVFYLSFLTFTVVFSLILAVFSVIILLKGVDFNGSSFLYLSIFVFLAGVWMFTDSCYAVFYLNNMTLVRLLSFSAFMLLPLPYMQYMKTVFSKTKSCIVLDIISLLIMANCILTMSANIFFNIPLYEFLLIAHLLLILSVISVFAYFMRSIFIYKDKDILLPFFGYCVLIVGVSLSLFRFYLSNINASSNSEFFCTAFVLFMIILMVEATKTAGKLYSSSTLVNVYKKMAMIDIMTGLNNRYSFDLEMAKLAETDNAKSDFGIIVFDFNGLKYLNDNFGHNIGDEMIKGCSAGILSAFKEIGKCYRIGGDEFSVIVNPERLNDVDRCIADFYRIIDERNRTEYHKISVANGFASSENSGLSENDNTPHNLFVLADKRMYDNKSIYYKADGQADGQKD